MRSTGPVQLADMLATLETSPPSSESREPAEADHGRAYTWLAHLIIVAVAGGMAWHTWGHWGDFQIDCGREIYVPAAILRGKLLFRDLWYMYGPLAPYVQALLFRVFGVHLTVLYLFGLALTAGSALLTFEIARQFDLATPACLVPSLFFLAEAFYPFIFNFVFPYSYAASLAALLGLGCLYFVLRHARESCRVHLAIAAALGGLVVLTKQEFGFACVILLGCELAASYLAEGSRRELLRDFATVSAGLSPAVAGYGWFAWKVSPKVLFIDNWISTPGTYFMRVFGHHTMASQGFRFSFGEFAVLTAFVLLALALWSTIASLTVVLIQKLRLRSWFSIGLAVGVTTFPVVVILINALVPKLLLIPQARIDQPGWISVISIFTTEITTQMILPRGLFFLGFFFLAHASWAFWMRPSASRYRQEALLGTYAVLVALRVMMETFPSAYNYAVFFNVPLVVIFIVVVDRVVRWAARSLEQQQKNFLSAALLTVETAMLFVILHPNPSLLPTPFTSEYGTFYTRTDVAQLFPQIISFMKAHTKNGKDILVLPEPPSLYVFAGMEAPSRWYSLLPGMLAPEREPDFINDIVSSDVKYILIANRALPEYGVQKFGVGYNQFVYQWMMRNYTSIGQFGPVADKSILPYIVWIYEKKDAVEAPTAH